MNEDTRELDPTNARTVKSYVSVKQIMSAICSLIQKKENLHATTARKNFSPRRTWYDMRKEKRECLNTSVRFVRGSLKKKHSSMITCVLTQEKKNTHVKCVTRHFGSALTGTDTWWFTTVRNMFAGIVGRGFPLKATYPLMKSGMERKIFNVIYVQSFSRLKNTWENMWKDTKYYLILGNRLHSWIT